MTQRRLGIVIDGGGSEHGHTPSGEFNVEKKTVN